MSSPTSDVQRTGAKYIAQIAWPSQGVCGFDLSRSLVIAGSRYLQPVLD